MILVSVTPDLTALAYLGQAELRERDVESGNLEEICATSLLVLLNGVLVVSDLRSSGDLRNQGCEVVAEGINIIYLEE